MSRFKAMVTDGISGGLSPRQAIADALDYGVKGMKKGQHKAGQPAAGGGGKSLAGVWAQAAQRHSASQHPSNIYTGRAAQQHAEKTNMIKRSNRPAHEEARAHGISIHEVNRIRGR